MFMILLILCYSRCKDTKKTPMMREQFLPNFKWYPAKSSKMQIVSRFLRKKALCSKNNNSIQKSLSQRWNSDLFITLE